MIRRCDEGDFETIWAILNNGARAYKGIIPHDRWKEPYMSKEELQHEIAKGVAFWGYEREQTGKQAGDLAGVMGLQRVREVTLIRHAYVRTVNQGQGIGGAVVVLLERTDQRTGLSRDVGGCNLGHPLLRKTWL